MLPRGARERLAQPLREACEGAQLLRASHTLPIEAGLWGWYSDGLVERLRELATGLEHFPSDTSFGSLSKHVESVVASRGSALSVLYALEPFAPFDRDIAQRILQAVDTGLARAATSLEDGTEPPRPLELWRTCEEWPRGLPVDTEISLSQLFGLDEEPVDDIGDLKPGWVLIRSWATSGSASEDGTRPAVGCCERLQVLQRQTMLRPAHWRPPTFTGA
ncbi:hypothetical protein [Georgenia daeguensis]|uniref:Uncharacterized protein n=1 Tax=Georgenia daeguensis TaxID=908355 RepID=A0ABP6UP47_9MICO